MTTVKNVLKIVGVGLATFLVVLVGAYFALPMIAPGHVAGTEAESSTAPDPAATVAQASPPDTTAANGDRGQAMPSSPSPDSAGSDSKGPAAEASGQQTSETMDQARETAASPPGAEVGEATETQADGQKNIAQSPSVVEALRDSIEALRRRLRAAKEEADTLRQTASTLRRETETLRGQLAEAKSRRVKAGELSSALLDMRPRELNALLKDVNMSVLEQLYQRASGRSRTRLLQSMAPKRAARFVNQVVEGKAAQDSAKDSTESQVASQAARPSSE